MSSYDEHLISQAGGDGDVLGGIEARAAKYRVRSQLPQVEDLQDDRDYLLRLVQEQAAKLEAVRELADDSVPFKGLHGYTSSGVVLANDLYSALESKP